MGLSFDTLDNTIFLVGSVYWTTVRYGTPVVRVVPPLATLRLLHGHSSLLQGSIIWIVLRFGTPVVRDVPPLATLRLLYGLLLLSKGYLLDFVTLWYASGAGCTPTGYPILWLHVKIRYRFGMEWYYGVDSKTEGVCAEKTFSVINARSFVFLYFDFCVCLVHPSVTYGSVSYFNNVERQSLSVTRQGRFEMVRGKAHRNVHYLEIILILQILEMFCNPAMRTTRAKIRNAAKLFVLYVMYRTIAGDLRNEAKSFRNCTRQECRESIYDDVLHLLCIYIYFSCP